MNEEVVTELHEQWEKTVCTGMGDGPIEPDYFLKLTNATFQMLSNLESNSDVPNQVVRILVLMQEFAVYCWFSENDPYLNMWTIVSNILYDFLRGFEKSGSVYPKLKLGDEYNIDFFDFETNTLADIEICGEIPF